MEPMRPTRRLFLAPREVPGLLVGAVRGDHVALRRILGARRAGRTGLALALAALALAVPSLTVALIASALHLSLALYVVIPRRGAIELTAFQELLLSLWTVAPLFVALASLRVIWPGSPLPALIAVPMGHLLVWRGLRGGLE